MEMTGEMAKTCGASPITRETAGTTARQNTAASSPTTSQCLTGRGGLEPERTHPCSPRQLAARKILTLPWAVRTSAAASPAAPPDAAAHSGGPCNASSRSACPLGLVAQTILERTARVLLSDEELYRFRVVKLGERVRIAWTVFGYPWRSKRFKVSTPVFRWPCKSSARAEAASS